MKANVTIDDIVYIAKSATEKVHAEFSKFGWDNAPIVTKGIVEAVLQAAEERGLFDCNEPAQKQILTGEWRRTL